MRRTGRKEEGGEGKMGEDGKSSRKGEGKRGNATRKRGQEQRAMCGC